MFRHMRMCVNFKLNGIYGAIKRLFYIYELFRPLHLQKNQK